MQIFQEFQIQLTSINSPFFKSVSNIPLKNLSAEIFLLFVCIVAFKAKHAEG